MVNLVPRSFFDVPRFPSLWDEEEDFWSLASQPSGLSVSEDESHVYVEAQVPGVDAEHIDVTYDKGILWIKGSQEQEDKEKKYYRKAASSFSYRLSVPAEVDSKKDPVATYKNGVMKLVFDKVPEAQPKKIEVKKE